MVTPKKKPGPKPVKDAERYPCGKIKNRNENVVAIEARRRQFSISEDLAASQEGGCAAKRLLIKALGFENASKYFDAIGYIRSRHAAYQRALRTPVMRSAVSLNGGHGHDNSNGTDPRYVSRCQRDIDVWKDIEIAILQCRNKDGKRDAFAMIAIEQIILEDRDQLELLDSLRNALNAINRLRLAGQGVA